MGMLMHHTWLKQQEDAAKQPVEQTTAEKADEVKEDSAEPVKKTGGRRKATK